MAGEKERERIETFVRGRVKGVLSVTYACCKYLQCVVGCCSVLQCVVVCCSVLQCVYSLVLQILIVTCACCK